MNSCVNCIHAKFEVEVGFGREGKLYSMTLK